LPLKAAVEWFPRRTFAGAIIVSDNESWLGTGRYGSTATMTAWGSFLATQRKLAGKDARPKLINIDLQPYQTTQTLESPDIINIGGFSDSVFNVVSAFLSDNKNRFVSEVEAMEI
jgi:60 kDa SS-A/Ro ribonucleoprotein